MCSVTQFDVYKAEIELKKCPKIIRDYVKLLKSHNEHTKNLLTKAINKLKTT